MGTILRDYYMTFILVESLIKLASLLKETHQFHNFLVDFLVVLVRSLWKDSPNKTIWAERSGRYKWPFYSCFIGK